MEQPTLDFDALAGEIPAWARECVYCYPDDFGVYDYDRHLRNDLPMTCAVCGASSPNRLLFEQSHGVNLGASWESGHLLCMSLSLLLNHLTYDILHGREPRAKDLYAIELGWRIAPDGAQLPPEDWPPAPRRDE